MPKRRRQIRQSVASAAIAVAALLCVGQGCSRTVEHETRVVETSSPGPADVDYRREERIETKTEESDDGCGGVLSCTVNVVGEVIALPFKAVGYLFSAIF